jgi:competence protein ComER
VRATESSASVKHLGIIGTGSLGTALLRAAARFAPDLTLIASSRDPARIDALRREIPALRGDAPENLARASDLILLCVPPEAYLPVIDRVAGYLRPQTVLVSVTNSVSLETIAERVAVPVVKVIPTMAHVVGRGNALLIPGPRADTDHVQAIRRVFARFSKPTVINPADDRVASNISGSALALFAALAESFVAANLPRAKTITRDELNHMMAETLGAIAALVQAGYDWSEIVRTTATRGGMTEAALNLMMSQFPQIAGAMVATTFARQAELQSRECGASEVDR